jgi:hypothetical protein
LSPRALVGCALMLAGLIVCQCLPERRHVRRWLGWLGVVGKSA